MVGAGQVLLNFLEVSAHAGISCVFLSVNGAALQSEVNLGPCQRSGLSADSSPECHVVGVFHGTDLQALEVSQSAQILIGGGQTVGSVLQEAQQMEVGSLVSGGHILVEGGILAVQNSVDGVAVILGESHGQIEHGCFGNEGNGGGSLANDQLNVVGLHLAQKVCIAAQIAVGVVVDGQLAAGDLVHLAGNQFAEDLACSTLTGGVAADQLNGIQSRVVYIARGSGSCTAGRSSRSGAGSSRAAASHQRGSHGSCQSNRNYLLHL